MTYVLEAPRGLRVAAAYGQREWERLSQPTPLGTDWPLPVRPRVRATKSQTRRGLCWAMNNPLVNAELRAELERSGLRGLRFDETDTVGAGGPLWRLWRDANHEGEGDFFVAEPYIYSLRASEAALSFLKERGLHFHAYAWETRPQKFGDYKQIRREDIRRLRAMGYDERAAIETVDAFLLDARRFWESS